MTERRVSTYSVNGDAAVQAAMCPFCHSRSVIRLASLDSEGERSQVVESCAHTGSFLAGVDIDPIVIFNGDQADLDRMAAQGESFVINGQRYTVMPDVPRAVRAGKNNQWSVRTLRGFGGGEFVIVADDGRRIVTHNLWHRGPADGLDTARFEGRAAGPVRVRGYVDPICNRGEPVYFSISVREDA